MTLKISALKKRLGGQPILDGIDLDCPDAESIVVLGKNGSGKSTLLRLVAGILEPDAGSILIDGLPLCGGGTAARRKLGYVPDSTDPFPDLSVAELCALVSAFKQAPMPPPSRIAELGVDSFFHQRLKTLSFGQRKRACLLTALIGEPSLLILDEPTNGLDPSGVTLILTLIAERRRRGTTTLLSTNDKPFADALGAKQYHLRSGRLMESAADQEPLTE